MKIISRSLERIHSIAQLMATRYGYYQAVNPEIWSVSTNFVESYSNFIKKHHSSNSFGYAVVTPEDKMLGAVLGKLIDSPGVYNPGLTCLIEDFAVVNDADWHIVAPKMLERIITDFSRTPIQQFVFISPVTYTSQQQFFHSIGIYNCSQWWTGKINPINHSMVQKLESSYVEDAVALSSIKRFKYSKEAPVFWKMAPDADKVQEEFFLSMINTNSANPKAYIPMVFCDYSQEKSINGLIVGEHHKVPDLLGGSDIYKVDDFIIQNEEVPGQWSKIGKLLLEALSFRVGSGMQFQIVSGSHDTAKLALLKDLGLKQSINWWTTSTYNHSNQLFFKTHGNEEETIDMEVLAIREILD